MRNVKDPHACESRGAECTKASSMTSSSLNKAAINKQGHRPATGYLDLTAKRLSVHK